MSLIRTTVLLLGLIATLALTACGDSDKSAAGGGSGILSFNGTYGPGVCFKNRAASAGMGQDIFTIAKITLNANGTGSNEFQLFTDAGCTASVGSGTAETSYVTERMIGEISILKISQKDPGNPDQIYWLPILLTGGGLYVHINGNLPNPSGPYDHAPNDTELADFVADPFAIGIFFAKQ